MTNMQKTLPKGWKWVKIGEVAQIVSGSTPRTDVPKYWNGDILWVTPADLSKLDTIEINNTERKITKEGYDSCSTTTLPAGTVLLSSRAPIGHLAIAGKEMCTNQGFKSLIPNQSLNSYYLYFTLKRFKDRLVSLGSGATFTEISKTSVERFEIPLPPLPTQHKIVEILKEADNLRKLRRQADEKMKDLIPSLFVQMFGDPVKNPKGWEVKKLGDITERITSQILPTDLPDTEFFYIGLEHIESNTGTLINANHQKGEYIKSNKNKFEAGDILYGKLSPYLNKVLLVDRNGICSTDIWVLRPVKALTNSHFVSTFLMFQQIVNILNLKTEGANLPRVKATSFDRLPVPLPPLPLQQEFAKLVEDIEAEKTRQAESRKKLDELFQSLMQRAFTGELVS